MDFEGIALIALIATVVLALAHAVIIGPKRPAAFEGRPRRRFGLITQLIHALLALSFLTLAFTGLFSAIYYETFTGWLLWLHMVAAGAFLFALTLTTLLWAAPARFVPADAAWLRQAGGYLRRNVTPLPAARYDAGQKLYFWLLAALGLATITPILLSMLPLVGTAGQELLVELHAYGALLLTVITLWHIYSYIFVKRGTLRAMFGGTIDAGTARTFYPDWPETPQNTHE